MGVPDEAGDIPAEFWRRDERQNDVTFALYAKHLMSIPRYAAHPSLHFALKAIKDTAAGLGSMRFRYC